MIGTLHQTLCKWLNRKVDNPTHDEVRSWGREWEFEQVDTGALWRNETAPDLVNDAVALRRTAPEAGFKLLLGYAEAGSAGAMLQVGWSFEAGEGVSADP